MKMIQILKINAVKFDESIYSTIIKSFCKYNDIINVEKYLTEMKNNNIKLKQRTYTHLIQMYYNHDNVNKLKKLYNDVKIYKININANDYLLILNLLTTIFVAYCQDIYDILGSEGSDIRTQWETCQNPKT